MSHTATVAPRLRARGTVALVGVIVATTFVVATPAASTSTDEARLFNLTNRARISVGAAPLVLNEDLELMARNWATVLASAGGISHNPNFMDQAPSGWFRVGENVGMGPSLEGIHRDLLNSPTHYQNIVDAGFIEMGIGVVKVNGTIFAVQNFMQRAAAPPPVEVIEVAPIEVQEGFLAPDSPLVGPPAPPIVEEPPPAIEEPPPPKPPAPDVAPPHRRPTPPAVVAAAAPAPRAAPVRIAVALEQVRLLDRSAAERGRRSAWLFESGTR